MPRGDRGVFANILGVFTVKPGEPRHLWTRHETDIMLSFHGRIHHDISREQVAYSRATLQVGQLDFSNDFGRDRSGDIFIWRPYDPSMSGAHIRTRISKQTWWSQERFVIVASRERNGGRRHLLGRQVIVHDVDQAGSVLPLGCTKIGDGGRLLSQSQCQHRSDELDVPVLVLDRKSVV